jgi:Icc-related predicted phosphoesterase
MNIQIISDIHLEFGGFDLPDSDCDVLIAAGDIGVGIEGIEWLKSLDLPVIYVAGNHEYWGFEMNALQTGLSAMSKGSEVRYLEQDIAIIDGVRFLGCTLWTDFNKCEDEEMMSDLQNIMNDFRYISYDNSIITPTKLIELNQSCVNWLHRELAKKHDGPTIVVTHHAPTKMSWAADPDDYLMFAYCNQLESMLEEYEIDLWAHGHIHHTSDYTKHGVRVICNPRGYIGYQTVEKFDAKRVIKI